MKNIISALKKLTVNDLNQWAGDAIVGRAKGYFKHVENLSYCTDGRLVAYINGSERYLTYISFNKNNALDSYCSCPYWATCKHAVALVLVAAEQVKLKREIPLLTEQDELYDDLFKDDEIDDDEYTETLHEDDRKRSKGEVKLKVLLAAKTKTELVEFLLDILPHHPKLIHELQNTEQLKTESPDKLITKLQRDIKKITSQSAWYDPWNNIGKLPDYSPIVKQMQNLLRNGYADALLNIGEELLQLGQPQIEQSDDEGKTAGAIAECMAVVVKALAKSSLTHSQQLYWFIEHEVIDDFELLAPDTNLLDDTNYQPEDWRELAGLLNKRIAKLPKKLDSYSRARWVTWLLTVYAKAQIKHQAIPLLEQEAERCNLQTQLIEALLSAGELTKARQYCIRFYSATIKTLPGIANNLKNQLRDIAQQAKKYDLVAAYCAQDFFADSTADVFIQLQKSTIKAACWPAIRLAVLEYLETGERPDTDKQRKAQTWPLPKPEVSPPDTKSPFVRFPNFDELIHIAIFEKRIDDVAILFERMRKAKQQNDFTNEHVAKFLSLTHPQIALDIWQHIAEQHIARVSSSAYVEAAEYLRLMHKVYKTTKRLPEWNALILRLRTTHKAKRRLLEVLDGLKDKKLVG